MKSIANKLSAGSYLNYCLFPPLLLRAVVPYGEMSKKTRRYLH